MRKIILSAAILLVLGGVMAIAKAQKSDDGETMIFGAAATEDGGQNMFVVEQPKDGPNPLGDPIVVQPEEAAVQKLPAPKVVQPQADNKTLPQNQTEKPANVQELGQDFQNTLMEANGRVYDIQSFPKQDMEVMGNPSNPETIYSPNVNN